MPMDGFTLGRIASELRHTIEGARVDKISQPEPDEIILSLHSLNRKLMLLISANAGAPRIQLTGMKRPNPLEPSPFCMLMRKHLTGSRIASIDQYGSDRIIDLSFDVTNEVGDRSQMILSCEFMGRHSNIILHDRSGKIIDSCIRVPFDISSVRQVLPGLIYSRPPLQDKISIEMLEPDKLYTRLSDKRGLFRKALSDEIMGLSPKTAEEIADCCAGDPDASCEKLNIAEASKAVWRFLKDGHTEEKPCIYYDVENRPIDVCLFPYRTYSSLRSVAYPDIHSAMDEFYSSRGEVARLHEKMTSVRHIIKRNIDRCERKLALRLQTLKDSENMEQYRIMGELLTASLSSVPKGASSVKLINWYDENSLEINIPLDASLSPAKNAQKYFKTYQKMRNAAKLAVEQIKETKEELEYFDGQMDNLNKCSDEADLNEIKTELQEIGYIKQSGSRKQKKALPDSKPFHYVSAKGYHIFVGKNNMQNERLTFSADPNEMWLHVKDMPGSHVIVKGTDPDEETLRDAAMLAAYYSKGTSSSNVPVDMTLRKYVKKPSGSKPGFVIFSHQRTIFITPDEQYIRSMTMQK